MIKHTSTYIDYNGTERTEDFYFNLSKNEILQWEWGVEGGLTTILDRIVKAQDGPQIIEYFKELVLKAYGEKSDDGRRFIKSDELSTAFSQTPAFDELYIKLFTDSDYAAEFVKGILPDDFGEDLEEELKKLERSNKEAGSQEINRMIDVSNQISS